MGDVAMCQWNSGVGRNGNHTGDARDDLKRYSGFRQRAGFFGSSAEHEGVSAFEPADGFTLPGLLDHKSMDPLLLEVFVSGFFADVDDFSVVASLGQKAGINQTVVEYDFGVAKTSESSR